MLFPGSRIQPHERHESGDVVFVLKSTYEKLESQLEDAKTLADRDSRELRAQVDQANRRADRAEQERSEVYRKMVDLLASRSGLGMVFGSIPDRPAMADAPAVSSGTANGRAAYNEYVEQYEKEFLESLNADAVN